MLTKYRPTYPSPFLCIV